MCTLRYIVLILFSLIIYGSSEAEKNVSIVIIGTGPAGIAAATWLLKHQFNNIKLLEAEGRIGKYSSFKSRQIGYSEYAKKYSVIKKN